MWHYLVEHSKDYGFLGPIVGIVGLLSGASAAISFAFWRKLDTWKPPQDTFPEGLEKVVGMLCAVGLFAAWILADPNNGPDYLHTAIRLAVASLIAFLVYVGLRAYPGRFRKPQVGANNRPTRADVIWGGFWLWKDVRREVRPDNPVEKILAGKLYDRSQVWPPFSLMLSAVVTALVLIALLVCGTLALSTAGASIQVALTGKPARAVFSTSQVPGLSPAKPPTAPETPSPGDGKKETPN
jgi:hypothetical protein